MKLDIDKIITKVFADKASQEEYAALEAWKNESAENLKSIQQLMPDASSELSDYKEYDKLQAWNKISSQIEEPTRKSPIFRYAVLGIITLIALAALFFWTSTDDTTQTHYIADEETINFQLPDDSKIWLRDGGSTLDIISFEDGRQVALSGAAFFDVAHDKERPFTIKLNDKESIRVVGTSFSVFNNGNDLDILVYSGIIELRTLDRKITVGKDERIKRVTGGALAKVKQKANNDLSWKTNELVFEDSGLDDVFQAIEDHFRLDIQVQATTKDISTCKVRTRFKDQSLESILDELSQHFKFNYDILDKTVSISDLKCH